MKSEKFCNVFRFHLRSFSVKQICFKIIKMWERTVKIKSESGKWKVLHGFLSPPPLPFCRTNWYLNEKIQILRESDIATKGWHGEREKSNSDNIDRRPIESSTCVYLAFSHQGGIRFSSVNMTCYSIHPFSRQCTDTIPSISNYDKHLKEKSSGGENSMLLMMRARPRGEELIG